MTKQIGDLELRDDGDLGFGIYNVDTGKRLCWFNSEGERDLSQFIAEKRGYQFVIPGTDPFFSKYQTFLSTDGKTKIIIIPPPPEKEDEKINNPPQGEKEE